ncbi:hypothetical protein EVAR_27861_1 [Eumeta japonica]|uniref:Uncharacterized protein n=1 Tax=Eumeta variegata TaxID=151549 RepID=A0A4C1VJB1_EUMVA|nr:hypothetical protein EVAR_27861_1 [Eumeta japonica]
MPSILIIDITRASAFATGEGKISGSGKWNRGIEGSTAIESKDRVKHSSHSGCAPAAPAAQRARWAWSRDVIAAISELGAISASRAELAPAPARRRLDTAC